MTKPTEAELREKAERLVWAWDAANKLVPLPRDANAYDGLRDAIMFARIWLEEHPCQS